jgi:hypothetical protein
MDAIAQLRSLPHVPATLGPASPAGSAFSLLRHCLVDRHFGPSLWTTLPDNDPGMQHYTPTLQAEVLKFQVHLGLPATGTVDAATWSALAGYDPAAWGQTVHSAHPASLLERHIANLHDAGFRHKAYHTGRGLASPACAAVASQYYIGLGILHKTIVGAQELADHLETHCGLTRHQLAELRRGDLVVCDDLNGNGRSDHVTHVYETQNAKTFLAVDNQHLDAYVRNLVAGVAPGKTPAEYVLRLG